MVQKRFSATRRRRLLAPGLAAAVTAGALAIGPAPAQANPGDIGYACGYYSNVSLFGGPYGSMGCGTQTSSYASANSASPSVSADFSNTTVSATDSDGAAAVYGPAHIFSSPYLAPSDTLSNSGPLEVSAGGSATAITARAKATGVGPSPFWTQTPAASPPYANPAASTTYDGTVGYVEATCTAVDALTHSGTTTIKNGRVDTATDASGYPTNTVVVPDNPPPNYRVDFTIDNVGDHGHMVFNEQTNNVDTSLRTNPSPPTLTVNGAHMYMEGPTALGDVFIAQVQCARLH